MIQKLFLIVYDNYVIVDGIGWLYVSLARWQDGMIFSLNFSMQSVTYILFLFLLKMIYFRIDFN